MLIPFEQFIDRANCAETNDELVSTFLETVGQHGYDKMIFCLLNEHESIGLSAGVGHLRNYPKDWMAYYFSQSFDQIDPVISYCYQKMGTFTWGEMADRLELTNKQKKCLNLGIESGLNNGICTPLWGGNRFAGIGLASSEKKDAVDNKYDLITAYCNHFYLAFHRLHEKNKRDNQIPNIVLTKTEKEVLLWASRGKSDGDIGDILSISDNTVKYHIKNIYTKLEANTRVVAVTKAISLGLIRP